MVPTPTGQDAAAATAGAPAAATASASGVSPVGLLVSLLDAAMVQAAIGEDVGRVTARALDLHPLFLHTPSGALTATGRRTGGGRSVCFCEAEARDASGAVVARAMGTYRLTPAVPAAAAVPGAATGNRAEAA